MSPAPVPASVPVRTPDLCAEFAGRRFRLRPPGRSPYAAPAEISFDLWEGEREVLARQHGAAAAEAEIARLRRWAEERGRRLRIGVPIPPLDPALRPALQPRHDCEV